METEQLQNFNDRLSQWVANQGFWFQVRYSMSGTGMKGRAMFHLLRMAFRLLIFLLLAAVGVWIYLVKRTDSARFIENFRKELHAGFSASELEIRGFNHLQGQLEINRLASQGGEETFYTALEARNIRCKMGLVDGLIGFWKPGIISVSRLDIDLRAGVDDEDSARKLSEALFRKPEKIEISALEVGDATFRWGYSERTQGSIESSALKMQRTETGWRLAFKGGTFSQNWLRKLEIINLVAVCEPAGLLFEKAEFKLGDGTVNMSGLRLEGGERPEVKGVAKIRNLNLEDVLPPALRSFVEGTFSGDFDVFGSTNTSDGIGFDGQVVLDGKDTISLRERFHILKALSVVDYSRNYHRIDFREGSFQMKSIKGGLEITALKLKADELSTNKVKTDELFTMEGAMKVRLPTDQEVQEAISRGSGLNSSPIFAAEDEAAEMKNLPKTESEWTLKRVAQEARRIKDGVQSPDSLTLFDRLGLGIEMRRMQSQASERMSRMLRYEGMFRISIPRDAFERAPRLQTMYPVDPNNGRISLNVPIEGHLYELTLKQAEEIYQLGQR
jgi:hypothetical protein